ncbi:uncharacterized protein LOC115573695 isoform X1 [Sparus aurata]|uniref:uncharacterized protein LOC115573695 isoform X1 n=1 Tax=Sparus aurata TaxID=8175 RepID=UPI0011C1A925|nr:uncharacterized protein LOC115573695 isoform X1 [Sparus aurata]
MIIRRETEEGERQRIMMVQFKWIQMSLFVTAMLQFTAVTGLNHTSVTARVGDEVTLPCDNVINTQDKCDSTSWLANRYGVSAKQLVNLGRISKSEIPRSRSDRLSVTESCSLVITNVSVEDVGRYSCRQFDKSGRQQGEDALVHLSVVNVEKLQQDDRDMLTCYVLSYGDCGHTVKWLYDDNMDGVETVRLGCSATVKYKPPHLNHKSNYHKLPECEVTDDQSGQTLLWKVNSGSKTSSAEDDTTPQLARTDCSVVDYIMLVLRVAELVLITVITVLLIRAPGNQKPVRLSGAAASQVDHDEDDGVVKYENRGDTSASVRLH